jgi:predicted nuclease of restriction endonuclease-like RecB superfamily
MENIEKATDMEIALFWSSHIENPCETIVDGKKVNIRDFYIRESKKIIPNLTNPFAQEYLERTISKYEKNDTPKQTIDDIEMPPIFYA